MRTWRCTRCAWPEATPPRQEIEPAYLSLQHDYQLAEWVAQAYEHMTDCDLCAPYCHVDPFRTIKGAVCRTGKTAVANSFDRFD